MMVRVTSILAAFFFIRRACSVSLALTRAEAEHLGLPSPSPPLAAPFASFLASPRASSSFSSFSSIAKTNDFMGHHQLLESFCKYLHDEIRKDDKTQTYGNKKQQQKKKGCKWEEYYSILDDVLRKPFENLFDPTQRDLGDPIEEILKAHDNVDDPAAAASSCLRLEREPTAGEFLGYVKKSQPFIFQRKEDSDAKQQKSRKEMWSFSNLRNLFGHRTIVVSGSPSSEFDGPEDPAKWGVTKNDFSDEIISTPDLIARPAHIQLSLAEYIQLLENSNVSSSNLYLEYFPLAALVDEKDWLLRKPSQASKINSLMKSIPPHSFSNFLSKRYQLLWFSIGGTKAGKKKKQRQSTSRLHFDRMENLMTVLAGSKTFKLYSPLESKNLYSGEACISASFSAAVSRTNGTGPIENISFSRNKTNINFEMNYHHTYSPVNVKRPDLKRFPRFRDARGFSCTVHEGETLFLPAHWWHEVTSMSDEEGKCLGINRFFEPMYLRPQYNSTLSFFQTSNYYGHLLKAKSAVPCNDTYVCFTKNKSGPSSEKKEDAEKSGVVLIEGPRQRKRSLRKVVRRRCRSGGK